MSDEPRQPPRYEPWGAVQPATPQARDETEPAVGGRELAYTDAIREALAQAMTLDERVFVMGQDVDAPPAMFGTTRDLAGEFGPQRCFDTPLAENAMMGVAVGAALAGMRPCYLHNRPDFLVLALDQLCNHAAKYHYTFGGRVHVPMVVWACTGRGWGSASQHSQALQGLLMHVPGLKLVMPCTPFDAKGLLLAAIEDPNPVLVLEHRFNFRHRGPVPEPPFTLPLGKGVIRREGDDVTLVAVSHMVHEALDAARVLAGEGVEAQVVDLRSLRPLDEELVLAAVARTGRAVIADCGWKTAGVTAEIAALLAEQGFDSLRAPVQRVACPDVPTPAGYTLEDAFYVGRDHIVAAARRTLGGAQ